MKQIFSMRNNISIASLLMAVLITTGFFGFRMVHEKPDDMRTVVIEKPWARPTIGSIPNSVVYFSVKNNSDESEKITGAKSEIAERIEIHTHIAENGAIMMMKVEKPIEIPAKGKVSFKAGGLHIMLMGLSRKLNEGDSFPLTLVLEKKGAVTLEVKVQRQKFGK